MGSRGFGWVGSGGFGLASRGSAPRTPTGVCPHTPLDPAARALPLDPIGDRVSPNPSCSGALRLNERALLVPFFHPGGATSFRVATRSLHRFRGGGFSLMGFAGWWFELLGEVEKSDFFDKIGLLGRS
jgi:hypothetical protein